MCVVLKAFRSAIIISRPIISPDRGLAMTDKRPPPRTGATIQGAQVGRDNTMVNLWPQERRADPARIEHLSPHAGAEYVAGLPPEEAAVVLASGLGAAAAGVLRVLVSQDQELAIAVLSRITRRKAEELIRATGPTAAELMLLPTAAEAMADCRLAASADLGPEVRPLSACFRVSAGYTHQFADGAIYWCAAFGAQLTRGPIYRYSYSRERLGYAAPERPAQRSPFGTEGLSQKFNEGFLGGSGQWVYWSQRHGPVKIYGPVAEFFERAGGTGGPMGFPTSEMKANFHDATQYPRPVGHHQRFEGGILYYRQDLNGIFVRQAIAEHHDGHGGVLGDAGLPTGTESKMQKSNFGTKGSFQIFDFSTIYSSDRHGVHCVAGPNRELYLSSGGPGGWLGFPRSDRHPPLSPELPYSIQAFEGGTVYDSSWYGCVAVPGATTDFIS